MKKEAIYLHNSTGKEWLIQRKYCKVGCELYQPSAWKGKLVVNMLPVLAKCPITPLRTVCLDEFVPNGVIELMQELFGSECNYSAFMGTPGTHKKPTIQVSKKKDILGYVKYSRDLAVQSLFKKEQNTLIWLSEKGVPNVPECLALQALGDSLIAFVQSTHKKVGTSVEHGFGSKQKSFLDILYRKTNIQIPFESTDFYFTIRYIQDNIGIFNEIERSVIERALRMIDETYSNHIVNFGACHRDFTPWNTCVVDDSLFVFDWEYAQRTYPRGIDQCHFYIQTKKFEQHLPVNTIAKQIKENDYYGIGKLSFIAYCLDNAAIYMQRARADDMEKVKEQIQLLGYLEQ